MTSTYLIPLSFFQFHWTDSPKYIVAERPGYEMSAFNSIERIRRRVLGQEILTASASLFQFHWTDSHTFMIALFVLAVEVFQFHWTDSPINVEFVVSNCALSIPLNGFLKDVIETGIRASDLSIPLNGFLSSALRSRGSFKFESFQFHWTDSGEEQEGQEGQTLSISFNSIERILRSLLESYLEPRHVLSIPLNGFLLCATPQGHPALSPFNSIERIRKAVCLSATYSVSTYPFNSIERIPYPYRAFIAPASVAETFNSIERIHSDVKETPGERVFKNFQFHWTDST